MYLLCMSPSAVPSAVLSFVSTNAGQLSPVPSSVPSPGDSPSPVPSSVPSPGDSLSLMPSPMPSKDSCGSASTAGSSSDESSESTFLSSLSQHNGPCKRIVVRKLKKSRRLIKFRHPKTKLLSNQYIGPGNGPDDGDGWLFLGSSDPSDDSLDVPLLSLSSVAIN